MREVPTEKIATLYRGAGKWFQRRNAAYYAIAKQLFGARYPRWLDDEHSDGPYIHDRTRTLGSVLAEGEGIADWHLRREKMWDLFYRYEGGSGFDPDKWRRVCRRLAKFLAFVDRRRKEIA